jgi:hypothetical protein
MSTELVNNFYIAGKIVLILGALKGIVYMWILIIRSFDLRKAFAEMQESCDSARRSIILGAPKPPKFLSLINNIVAIVK